VDWMLTGRETSAISALRSELTEHLRRHSGPRSDLSGAELAISELVTNAMVHAEGSVWVSLDWTSAAPRLRVADLGPGFALDDPDISPPPVDHIGGRGLYIASQLTEQLEARRRRNGGSIVSAVLPVSRAHTVSIDPPRRRLSALPGLDEATPTGGFAREPFLRALVVHLAMAVADQQGPVAAERAVAQVAADVGGQMEAEYRAATGVTDRLTPQQLAECYVRLKGAIDGGFSIVEVTDRRIVLANTRCPFGDVVTRAPSLCRMTSSVFGGIAAANSDTGADVLLEERIAVGDSQCRVVIDLDPPDDDPQPWVHRYRPPTSS
jgi:anti-sigma regulatory factor (Ser/Thr protein kinase)